MAWDSDLLLDNKRWLVGSHRSSLDQDSMFDPLGNTYQPTGLRAAHCTVGLLDSKLWLKRMGDSGLNSW